MAKKPKAQTPKPKAITAKKPPSRDDLILARARNALKRITEGPKFSHRPYKPKKRKAPKGRFPADILKEARAARVSLVRRGSSRAKPKAWELAVLSVRLDHTPTTHGRSRPAFEPILKAVGNPPTIASGHGQFDPRPEVWAADDFFVIVEANPRPISAALREITRFRYLMAASCFYRESRNPYPYDYPRTFMVFTLEHSAVLLHKEPGLIGKMLGAKAEPLTMIVGKFVNGARLQAESISYDDDFARGRELLLRLVREALGITASFDHAGYFTKGHFLPAMR